MCREEPSNKMVEVLPSSSREKALWLQDPTDATGNNADDCSIPSLPCDSSVEGFVSSTEKPRPSTPETSSYSEQEGDDLEIDACSIPSLSPEVWDNDVDHQDFENMAMPSAISFDPCFESPKRGSKKQSEKVAAEAIAFGALAALLGSPSPITNAAVRRKGSTASGKTMFDQEVSEDIIEQVEIEEEGCCDIHRPHDSTDTARLGNSKVEISNLLPTFESMASTGSNAPTPMSMEQRDMGTNFVSSDSSELEMPLLQRNYSKDDFEDATKKSTGFMSCFASLVSCCQW